MTNAVRSLLRVWRGPSRPTGIEAATVNTAQLTGRAGNAFQRLIVVAVTVSLLALHWLTPTTSPSFHVVHIALRNLLFLPVFLGAIWLGVRGGITVLVTITLLYLPHIWLHWSRQTMENFGQYGYLVSLWAVGLAASAMASAERKAQQRALDVQEGALAALVSALDARERDTKSHSVRVRDLALRIGQRLGLKQRQLLVLAQGALLHDIGKIGVPDAILMKPEKLMDYEWRIMKTHPEQGKDILDSMPALREVAEIVYAHHEWYDGSGYPLRLRGEAIPLGARIFAVADVFDALTTDRPYHRAIDAEAARQEIAAASGSHFDPSVVAAFLTMSIDDLKHPKSSL